MNVLDTFIESYQDRFHKDQSKYDDTLAELVDRCTKSLMDEKLSPPAELGPILKQLHIRSKEPMKVAVTGQFSSGKSTFLNALLSKNVLPTGIIPVTSKVNYIRYGDEFRMRVHYKDGRDEYQQIEYISRFTDQRSAVEDIEYLTLYAPLEMLKEITFVDTPGLNSQEDMDTDTTEKVLREVDGIIWLSLIDNAGKMSEARTLAKYMDKYQGKSLCVLNQKDRFDTTQVEQSVSYVKSSFAEFFSEVVPISARDALLSRSHDKSVLIEDELKKFLHTISRQISGENELDINQLYDAYRKKVKEILHSDLSKNKELQESSNINAVLEFIETHIRQISHGAKAFSIKNDLKNICLTIIEQHKLFIRIYDELLEELELFETEAEQKLFNLKEIFGKELHDAYNKIEEIIDVISDHIYRHIVPTMRTRYVEKRSGLLKQTVLYEPVMYKSSKIESDAIYKYLFYEDDIVGKMFKKYVKNLRNIQDEVNRHNAEVYDMLDKRIREWQKSYELLYKQDPIHSNMEFANIRKFASRVYEYILKPFSDQIQASYAKVSSEFSHLSSAVSFNYQNATEVSIAFLEQKIEQSVVLYESDPTRFSLYIPKGDEIKERLAISFHLYELQNMMNSKKTFLSKNYDTLMREFKQIKQDREHFLEKRKERHKGIIETIEAQIKEIDA